MSVQRRIPDAAQRGREGRHMTQLGHSGVMDTFSSRPYVRAETIQAAVALIGHPEVSVYHFWPRDNWLVQCAQWT